jgi:hypothetical protein
MRLKDTVEILYLSLMVRWQTTAPPNRKQGCLDGRPERNTQISRLSYILKKIAAGSTERTYSRLAACTRRTDGESYISRNPSWMKQPSALCDGWYFEGCISLKQKQIITQGFSKLGLSGTFIACVDDFVAGNRVEKYYPTRAEEEEILAKIKQQEEKESYA